MATESQFKAPQAPTQRTAAPPTVVLVGLMGAGKSCVGRRLAGRLGREFVDTDDEIVKAAGLSIADIFRVYGEPAFRNVERKVMTRLLEGPACVLATGGGAFMDPETRALIVDQAVSVWLRADLDILVSRTTGRTHRPLLNCSDPRAKLQALMTERYPVYAEADVVVDTGTDTADYTTQMVLDALAAHNASLGGACTCE